MEVCTAVHRGFDYKVVTLGRDNTFDSHFFFKELATIHCTFIILYNVHKNGKWEALFLGLLVV